jgi:hypothetical protein
MLLRPRFFSRWRNVLIDSKKIVRIVLLLNLGEAIVVQAIGEAYTAAFIGREKIDIDSVAREGG